MAKRSRRYQLPKNWIVLPLIVYTLIFIFSCFLIKLAYEFFSSYTSSLKGKADIESTRVLAKLYDEAPIAQEGTVINTLNSSGYDWIITDSDMNIIRSHGEATANLTKIEKDQDNETVSVIRIGDEELRTDAFEDMLAMPAYFFSDRDTEYVTVTENKIIPNFNDVVGSMDMLKKLYKDRTVYIPYWTAFCVKDDTETIAFKTYFELSLDDMGYFAGFFGTAYIVVIIIFIVLLSNILRTHKNNRKMRKLVFSDNITKDHNWFWFAIRSMELLRKRRGSHQYAMISLSFVRYRNYVLCHSVEAGENTLKNLWKIINGSLDDRREACAHSTIANFPILMMADNAEHAREKLMTIIKRLESIGGDHDFKFQAGICMIDASVRKNADIDLLYNNASSARMTLEGNDDTGIAFFDQKLVEDEKWIDKVTERQREAIEKEEFKIYYQPKYDPRTNELMGAEALIRWISEDMGFVAPGNFIPIFENSGFITEIDHYMVSHVARDQKKWLDEGKNCVPVSVNVSRAHFAEINLAEQLRDMVDKEGAPRDLIEIELTESAFFDDKKVMLSTIKKLKEYGFLVSMDDFGSGYSSLNSLKDMPLDILKLDAGFFKGEKDNERTEIVVAEALQLAKKLNMTTVAEGVEDQEQVDFLAAEGCNMIQGYYYSKPMPKEEYESRILTCAPKTKPQAQDQNVRTDTAAPVPVAPAPDQNRSLSIRRIEERDAEQVSQLIRKTISISNTKDYPKELMDQLIASETPEHVLEMASWTHFYVVELGGSIIGCGAIGPYWGKEDESSLFTIFVLPEYQHMGVGHFIINALEKDEFFLRAKRIEIPASITGVPFYLRMGYNYKNGIKEPDEEHLIRLEKFR